MEQSREEIQNQRVCDFKHAFGGPNGERVRIYLSRFCLEEQSTFDEDSARKSDFNEGARSVILEINRWINLDVTKLKE